MKLPNQNGFLSRIPTPVLLVAWLAGLALAAGCLFWALFAPSGNGTPVASAKATATLAPAKVPTKTVTLPPLGTLSPAGAVSTPSAPKPTTAPGQAQPTTAPGSKPAAQNAPTATALPINETFGYGIQVNGMDDPDGSVGMAGKLGMGWLKQQVVWGSLEYEKGNMDWSGLDRIVRKANKANLKIMLSIVTAPTWSHPALGPVAGEDPNGIKAPPDDPNAYANFVGQVVDHYKALGFPVHAIEVWNEQNLQREWRSNPQKIDAARYMQMLSLTYKAVKARDPNIVVISGALSPTGVDNGVDSVDDFKYLQQMVSYGLLNNSDCIGIHHNGYNIGPNVPYQDAPQQPVASRAVFRGPFVNQHHSWSFYTTLNESARILNKQKPLCITEFGWPSSEGISTPVRQGFEFSKDNSLQDQANYITQAFQLMKQWGFVKIAFLWNLNFFNVTSDPTTTDNAIYSLLGSGGVPRPAFDALSSMPK